MSDCPNCGADESQVVPVWEEMENYENEEQPKYLGCTSCHKLMRTRYLRDQDDEVPPQAKLNQHERDYLSARNMVGNQHSNRLSPIEWRCVKGAAVYYGVTDWKSKADSTLTAEENVSLMEKYGTKNNRTTLRETPTDVENYGEG